MVLPRSFICRNIASLSNTGRQLRFDSLLSRFERNRPNSISRGSFHKRWLSSTHWAEPPKPKKLHWALRFIRNTAVVVVSSMFLSSWHFKSFAEDHMLNGQSIGLLPYSQLLVLMYREFGIFTTHFMMFGIEFFVLNSPPDHPLHKNNMQQHGFDTLLRPGATDDEMSSKWHEILDAISMELQQHSSSMEQEEWGDEVDETEPGKNHHTVIHKMYTYSWNSSGASTRRIEDTLSDEEEVRTLRRRVKNRDISIEEAEDRLDELERTIKDRTEYFQKHKEKNKTKDRDKDRDQ